jgi:peptidoglycan hydrolase CwlO-like protein
LAKLKKIWKWIKDNTGWIIAGVVAILIFVFSIDKDTTSTKTKKIRQLEKDIVKAENEVNFLLGKKEMLKEDYAENEAAILEIDKKLENLENQLNLNKQEINKRTMEENLERFKELGY